MLGETVVSTSTSLFTSSFKVDTFPLEKKTGEPLTVHKKDDKMDRGNLKRHFKKAFDCVNHDILPNKLQHQFGIHSPPSNWLTSYLTLKQQYMVLNGQRLSLYSVSSGTSQGSVLRGPCYWPYTPTILLSWLCPIWVCLHVCRWHYLVLYQEDHRQHVSYIKSTPNRVVCLLCE